MFVQFVGLPGAGKSSLARAMMERRPDLFRVVNVPQKSVYHLAARRPIRALRIASLIFPSAIYALNQGHPSLSLAERVSPTASLTNFLTAYEDKAVLKTGHVLIFEEFTLQRCLSLLAFGSEKPTVRQLSAFITRFESVYPALPVFLDLEADAATERAMRRAEGPGERMRKLTHEARSALYQTQQEVLEDMRSLVSTYQCVDARLPLAQQCSFLEDRLMVHTETSSIG